MLSVPLPLLGQTLSARQKEQLIPQLLLLLLMLNMLQGSSSACLAELKHLVKITPVVCANVEWMKKEKKMKGENNKISMFS